MKKILAIVLAVAMLMAMAVTVSADEVIYSEDTLFFSAGSWSSYTLELPLADFVTYLATPGAYVVITRSTTTDVNYVQGESGVYEKFCFTDSWYSGNLGTDAEGNVINTVRLGTGTHTMAAAPEFDVTLDCVLDDGVKVWYDAAALLAQLETFQSGGSEILLISNTSSTAYDIVNISIIVPDAPIVAPADDEPAVEETPAEDTPVAEEPKEEEPAETGLVLAVVPMVVAAAAIALSKKR